MLRPGALLLLGVRGADNRLDFVAVDETSDVGVGDLRRREATLVLANCTVHLVITFGELTCSPS